MAGVNRRVLLHSIAVQSRRWLSSVNVQTALEDDRCSQASPAQGYDDQRLQLKRGARFVFQGDSITEMKWGRNRKTGINVSDIVTST